MGGDTPVFFHRIPWEGIRQVLLRSWIHLHMHILSSSMSNNSIGEKTGGQESGEKGRGVRARGGCAGGL